MPARGGLKGGLHNGNKRGGEIGGGLQRSSMSDEGLQVEQQAGITMQRFHWAWIGVEKQIKGTAGLKLAWKECATPEERLQRACSSMVRNKYFNNFWKILETLLVATYLHILASGVGKSTEAGNKKIDETEGTGSDNKAAAETMAVSASEWDSCHPAYDTRKLIPASLHCVPATSLLHISFGTLFRASAVQVPCKCRAAVRSAVHCHAPSPEVPCSVTLPCITLRLSAVQIYGFEEIGY
ncbi:hypothetical protein GGX14DRAFT_392574 [Mycena pura]|uniref:Uncharacterized protein n=1 Tax=Mycena pura TaxID=153505 RepID=A0AAD6VJ68_9AGAR|nr:hypothetical protein GGX14DRAFT_392574 [Mycena pura]